MSSPLRYLVVRVRIGRVIDHIAIKDDCRLRSRMSPEKSPTHLQTEEKMMM